MVLETTEFSFPDASQVHPVTDNCIDPGLRSTGSPRPMLNPLGRLTMSYTGLRPLLVLASVCLLASTLLTACSSPSSETSTAQTTASEPAPAPMPPPTNYKK